MVQRIHSLLPRWDLVLWLPCQCLNRNTERASRYGLLNLQICCLSLPPCFSSNFLFYLYLSPPLSFLFFCSLLLAFPSFSLCLTFSPLSHSFSSVSLLYPTVFLPTLSSASLSLLSLSFVSFLHLTLSLLSLSFVSHSLLSLPSVSLSLSLFCLSLLSLSSVSHSLFFLCPLSHCLSYVSLFLLSLLCLTLSSVSSFCPSLSRVSPVSRDQGLASNVQVSQCLQTSPSQSNSLSIPLPSFSFIFILHSFSSSSPLFLFLSFPPLSLPSHTLLSSIEIISLALIGHCHIHSLSLH